MSSSSLADPDIGELSAYLDGQSGARRRIIFEGRLGQEPALRGRLIAWRENDEAIRQAFDDWATEPLPPALSIAAPGRRPILGVAVPPALAPMPALDMARPAPRWRAAALVVASFLTGAGVVLATDGLAALRAPAVEARPDDAGTRHALEAHRTFSADTQHPVEVPAAQSGELATWLSGRTGLNVNPPDLSRVGLTLIGGRVTPGASHPAALLLYEGGDGHRIGLTIAPSSGPASRFAYAQSDVAGAVSWSRGPATFVVTGPADRGQLYGIARIVAER